MKYLLSCGLSILLSGILFIGCQAAPVLAPASSLVEPSVPPSEAAPLAATTQPALPTVSQPEATVMAPTAEISLPPEPLPVEFQASDGQKLDGLYFPAASYPAPLVVLMHWAGGDKNDWSEIAYWLQNRGLGGQGEGDNPNPWLDPSWFPPMPAGSSYGVFTFTFRDCEGGCKSFQRDKWYLDAQAAMQTVSGLDGVDPQKIAAVGASIGADGAADGCFWLNELETGARCLGSLSLSPGSYLNYNYIEAVKRLGADTPPRPAWCVYGELDPESAAVCGDASGSNYKPFNYPTNDHGMSFLQPKVEPGVMELILKFLSTAIAN